MSRVAVIGGGAAGMMAALSAAEQGHKVCLYEKNEKLGKKLYITGKGRCNLTNACDPQEFLTNVVSNRKFLYSAFYGFTNQETMDFFAEEGLRIKTERGGRVFPVSDHASDVIAALRRALERRGVSVRLNTQVKGISPEKEKEPAAGEVKESLSSEAADGLPAEKAGGWRIDLRDGARERADAVIVCTGGLSYPATGSTGDGYRFALKLGHEVTECMPSLVPMETAEEDPGKMQGLSLKNVLLRLRDGKKLLFEDFGEMMFTHFGVTGPLVLSASAAAGKRLQERPLQLEIDLKPALSAQQLDARFLREFDQAKNKEIKNVLGAVYPAKMIPVILERAGIRPDRVIHSISKGERERLVQLTKAYPLTATALRGYAEAIITRGGVSVRQIRPDTMESKLMPGLYFAGEVLDLDALTGGYNLQIAWSTGRAAGLGIR